MNDIKNTIINKPYPLSENQAKAVISNSKYIKLVAGAGAGKTETLARKILYLLLEKKIEPKNIVAFTFTERAANSLKERIYNTASYYGILEDLNNIGEMYVGTIHSYSKFILEKYFNYGNYNLLNDNSEIAFLLNNRNELDIAKYEKNITYSILDFYRTTNMVYNEFIDKEELKKKATEFYIQFNKYNKLLDEYKLMTFGTVIHNLVIKLKENDEKIKDINVKYLLVDEFQDINYLQYILIKLIGKYANITIIGDKNQTIYQWRGSDYKYFENFNLEFDKVETITIPENRRSYKNIVSNANKFVRSFNSDYNDMESTNNENGTLILGKFETAKDEARNIVNTILELKKKSIIQHYSDIGILMRSVKSSGDEIINELKMNDIPYVIAGKIGLFKKDEARVLGIIFSWFSGIEESKIAYTNSDKTNLESAYKTWSKIIPINYSDFMASMHAIKKLIDSNKYNNLTKIFQDVLEALHFTLLDYEANKIIMANIGKFNELLTDYETANWYGGKHKQIKKIIDGLYYYINSYATGAYEEQEIDDITDIDAVTIGTIHQAKGLEWPIIFLTSMNQSVFPISRIGKSLNWCDVPDFLFNKKLYEGTLEDEKRLFYVAITRAKYDLIITNYKKKKARTYSDSEFLNDLDLNLFENYSTNNKYYMVDSSAKDIMKSYGITDLIRYNKCHYMFLLRNIFKYQPGINEAIGFGNALHFVLKNAAELVKQGYDQYSAIIEAVDESFHLPYAGEKTLRNFRNAGKTILSNFVEQHPDILKNAQDVEYNIEFPVENAFVVGKFDIVIKDNDLYEIIDYKTNKNVGTYDESYTQLNAYSIGLRKLGKEVSKGYVGYLTENELTEIDINDASVEDYIQETVNDLKNNNFNYNTGNHCSHCDVRKICKYYGEEHDNRR